ncbi:alpha/beta hydrolase [Herbaspirillum autotrophicum]|uniref:alpha/beta hydrolase n=1 Tax=Herbaspirillum autotrophicum TaxID=180195 RepID=UPI00067C1343|nr:alpha/beta hydrolase [Herbaspirillum autotrophicum]
MPTTFSLAEREREYSPSSCIGGNYQPCLQEYADRSAATPAACTVHRDLAYGEKLSERLDLFLPTSTAAASQPVALLVFIHGGYWQELSKASSLFAAAGCIEAGVAFAAIDYTLAPAAGIAEMVQECRRALRWLHGNAASFGIDGQRIVVAGSSAGAHLAAMTCLRDRDDDLPAGLPAGAVLVSGIYDLAPLIGTSIAAPLALTAATAGTVSPCRMKLDDFPPAIICWGEVETSEFKRQSRDFAALLAATDIAGLSCFEEPARNHFDVILDLSRSDTMLGAATLAMLHHTAARSSNQDLS